MADQAIDYAALAKEAGATSSTPPPQPDVPRDAHGRPLVSSSLSDGPPSDLEQALGPFAHPQTLTDFAKLLTLPVDTVRRAIASALLVDAAKRAPGAISSAASSAMDTVKDVASRTSVHPSAVLDLKLNQPLQFLRKVVSVAPKTAAAAEGDVSLPGYPRVLSMPPPAAVPPTIGEAAEASPEQAVRAFAPTAPTEAAPAAESAWAPKKLTLTAEEQKTGAKLLKEGKTDAEIRQAIETAREFQKRYGTPTPTAAQKRFPKGMRGAGGD